MAHDLVLSLCAKGCPFILFLNSNHLGYYSSGLPCLIDITLIRITLNEHDRWKSSGHTHAQPHKTHTCTDVGLHTHVLALYEQMESEVIFFLRGTRRQGEVSRAREGQLALQNYNAVKLKRKRKDCS